MVCQDNNFLGAPNSTYLKPPLEEEDVDLYVSELELMDALDDTYYLTDEEMYEEDEDEYDDDYYPSENDDYLDSDDCMSDNTNTVSDESCDLPSLKFDSDSEDLFVHTDSDESNG